MKTPDECFAPITENRKDIFDEGVRIPRAEIDLTKIKTPLEKAVAHLLRIGSTDKNELAEMSEEFITEQGACKKLGINYETWKASQI